MDKASTSSARRARTRIGKLDDTPTTELIRSMVASGASLTQIQLALEEPAQDRPGVSVAKSTIHKKIKALGLQLAAPPVAKQFEPASPEAIAAARRAIDPEAVRNRIRQGPMRKPSWIKSFEPDIRQLIEETSLTLYGIWDELAIRYGEICPQLARELTNSQKTSLIMNFISRESKRASRSVSRSNWAKIYLENGRANRAASPAQPAANTSKGGLNAAEINHVHTQLDSLIRNGSVNPDQLPHAGGPVLTAATGGRPDPFAKPLGGFKGMTRALANPSGTPAEKERKRDERSDSLRFVPKPTPATTKPGE